MSGGSNNTVVNGSTGLSPGAIAGVVVGTIAGILLVVLVCFCTCVEFWLFQNTTPRTSSYSTGQFPVIPSTGRRYTSPRQPPIIPSTVSRDASSGPSVAPPDPRHTLQEYRAESPARVGGEPRDQSDSQRREYPPTRTRFRSSSPPHVYLASEVDTDDLVQMARRDRGRG